MIRIAVCLLAVLALAGLPSCGCGGGEGAPAVLEADVPTDASMAAGEEAFALQVFQLVNAERHRAGLAPVTWSPDAADVAYRHCLDMRLRGYYGHYPPEGETPCERMRATGLDLAVCGGENIARGNQTPAEVMAAWMISPQHRANILEPLYTHIGVGVSVGAGGPWWTQTFFTPLPN